MDPLGTPSTAESSFFGFCFNYQRPGPAPGPLTARERPPSTSRGRVGFQGDRLPRDRSPPLPLSLRPGPQYQWRRVSPRLPRARLVPRGPGETPRGHVDPHTSRVTKAQPIEYRDHRDHRSLELGSLQRSPRNSSFGEHKCTLMKHSYIYPTGLRNYATLGRLARISRSVKRRKKKVTFRCSRGDSGRTDSCHSLESK